MADIANLAKRLEEAKLESATKDTNPGSVKERIALNLPALPLELLDHIAKILIDERRYATCANLNICSRDTHAGTLPTLYKNLHVSVDRLKNVFKLPVWDTLQQSEGYKHTRFLIVWVSTDGDMDQEDSDVASDLTSTFRHLKAVIFWHRLRPLFERQHLMYIVLLGNSYRFTDGRDHLDLWGLLNAGPSAMRMYVYGPPCPQDTDASLATVSNAVIKFIPLRLSAKLEPIVVRGNVQHDDGEDATAMSFTLVTCLAIASYAGRVWEEVVDDGGRSLLPKYVGARRVEGHAEEARSLQRYIQTYAECLKSDPRFVRIELALDTLRTASLRHRFTIARSRISYFRPLKTIYPAACTAVGRGNARMVSISSENTVIKLFPVFSKSYWTFRRAQVTMQQVRSTSEDEGPHGEGYSPFGPIDVNDL